MSSRTIYICDRPGCGKEIEKSGLYSGIAVYIRCGPLNDVDRIQWDLCKDCMDELHHDRVQADLDFGDRRR